MSLSQQAEKVNNDLAIKKLCSDKNYQILEDGRILTLIERTGKVSARNNWRDLAQDITRDGYVRYRYQYKYLAAHRIVYQKYIRDLDSTKQINHIDGNKKNNHRSNLEQVTQSANMIHMFDSARKKRA